MQNTCFPFFEGNIQGRKKRKGKKKKKKEETFEHNFLRANICLVSLMETFLIDFFSCEYKICVP